MSTYRFEWWPQVVWAVRSYPELKKWQKTLHCSQSLSQKVTGMAGGGDVSRTTENIVLKQIPPRSQQDYEAITRAIALTRRLPDGKKRIELIERMYWQGRKLTITQVSYQVNAGEALAKRWHREFILLVGKNLGYVS